MGATIISEDGRFEWDSDKDKVNKELHGFFLNETWPAFDDPYFMEFIDEAHSTIDEIRYKGLGELQDFIILFLSYTEQPNGRTRIISVRPAEPIEERLYYERRKDFNT
jgi:uncharacterized DUF497 family protein